MKRIALWSPKGGVGKTTLAINLAAAAYYRNHRVMLSDMDPQESAVDVFRDKNLPYTVIKGQPSVAPMLDFMFLDYPPRNDVELEGDLIVIPFRASILDIRAVTKSIRYAVHRPIVKCVNAVDIRRQDERLLALRMHSEGSLMIKNRSVYSRAIALGKSVFDSDIYGAAEARQEILRLFDHICARLEVIKNE
jgi:chromosome partitioning protein